MKRHALNPTTQSEPTTHAKLEPQASGVDAVNGAAKITGLPAGGETDMEGWCYVLLKTKNLLFSPIS
jgi:hypothetical protein